MNIHEYQAKQMLSRFGVRVPKGRSAFTPPEARAVAQVLGGDSWVVKAQIHAGGRGAGHFACQQSASGKQARWEYSWRRLYVRRLPI